MSDAPIHADNVPQADYWSGPVGRTWTDFQERQDELLRPISDRLVAAAAQSPTIDFAARVAPEGGFWASTSRNRCWRAPAFAARAVGESIPLGAAVWIVSATNLANRTLSRMPAS